MCEKNMSPRYGEFDTPLAGRPVRTKLMVLLVGTFAVGTAFGQSADEALLATGTQYQLLAAESVSFGPGIQNQTRKELLFKLASVSRVEVDSDESGAWSGDLAFDRIDFLRPGEVRMYDLTDGLSYSAGIDIEKTDEFDSQSEIISSRQLGIHYGRLGPENYSSVDLSFRHISDEVSESADKVSDDKELWSLGVTTGRRFELTGLDPNDPLWTVSLRGQFNLIESDTIDEALENQQWYVSPGLQWSRDSFRLTADVLMPFMQSGELEEESDYRIRAKIQKQF